MSNSSFKDLLSDESNFAIEQMHYSPQVNMNDNHFHNHYEILYIQKGSRTLYLNNTIEYTLDESNIALIRPKTIHKTMAKNNSQQTRILINISRSLMDEILKSLSSDLISCFNVHVLPLNRYNKGMLHYLFEELLDNKKNRNTLFDIKNKINLQKILLILSEIYLDLNMPERTLSNHSVQEKVDYTVSFFHNKFHEQISIPEIAEKLHISQTYLEKIFKESTGISPYKYLSSIRVINATRLLQSQTMNVSEIATACGFNNASSFTRIFKQFTDLSPKQYQIMYKQSLNTQSQSPFGQDITGYLSTQKTDCDK